VRGEGQWASGLLYSMERFSVGGQDTVRGYRENLLLGDDGVVGSIELSCPFGVSRGFCTARAEDWRTVRVAVFTDGGWVHNAINPQPMPMGIASVGVGLIWQPSSILYTRFTYAPELVKAPIPGTPDIQDQGIGFEITVHPLGLFLPHGR
jgi:hemolysin activation/secretion protein